MNDALLQAGFSIQIVLSKGQALITLSVVHLTCTGEQAWTAEHGCFDLSIHLPQP